MIEGIQSYTIVVIFCFSFFSTSSSIIKLRSRESESNSRQRSIFIFSTALRNEGKGTRFGGNLRLSLAFNLPLFLRTFYFFAPFPGQNAGKLNDYRNSINEAAEIKHGYGQPIHPPLPFVSSPAGERLNESESGIRLCHFFLQPWPRIFLRSFVTGIKRPPREIFFSSR